MSIPPWPPSVPIGKATSATLSTRDYRHRSRVGDPLPLEEVRVSRLDEDGISTIGKLKGTVFECNLLDSPYGKLHITNTLLGTLQKAFS